MKSFVKRRTGLISLAMVAAIALAVSPAIGAGGG